MAVDKALFEYVQCLELSLQLYKEVMLDTVFQAYGVLLPFTVSALTGQCRTLSTSWSQIYKSVSTFTAVLIGKLIELAQHHGNIIQMYGHYTTVDGCTLTVAWKL